MSKIALLIGVSEYEPVLEPLPSAVKDVVALQEVLAHPEMGEFNAADITVLQNPDRQTMETAIYTLFANRQKDDLVLLYFSGHGVLDDSSEFYFASRSTRKDQGKLVPPTAVAARSVQGWMEQSRSQRQVIILDSCFSGAFAKGVKAKDSGSVNLEQLLGGKGRAILTASTSTQYALTQEGLELSVYTHYLVEGIRTGGADQDDDGWIAADELHTYASSKVREAAPAMTPEFYPVKEGYKILLAKSPKDDPQLKYRKQVKQLAEEDEGNFSFINREYLFELQRSLGLSIEVATAIENEELEPFRQRQAKVDRYRAVFAGAIAHRFPLTPRDRAGLQRLQQLLSLRDEDIEAIEAPILAAKQAETGQISQPTSPPRDRKQADFFAEDLGNGITLDMARIPAGEFLIGTADGDRATIIQEYTRHGAKQEDVERWISWEIPQHRVTVPEFWLGKFAVTQAQWKQVAELPKVKFDLNPDPSNFKGAKRPAEQVSWDEAVEFCDRLNGFVEARLSKKTGRTYRLPTEAEWEYACRAGTTTPFHFGDTVTTELVNCNGNYPYGNAPGGEYRSQTTEVGSFPANAFGLYDMHGNVWEWCADQWYDSYANKPEQLKQNGAIAWTEEITGIAPTDNKNYRLLRGGSWRSNPRNCRSANRNWFARDSRLNFIGFRVVCSIPRAL
ncbi:SUMF1/EgtB/PvdO family nonheme iron enzyme [Oscillatoria sp. FACHB-1407]|uniref:caspase, EACC1-associated type n=1 Tax=Oscillatoria sp. FACHB-1407 TaxID=2692847 RepID=UPI001689EA02|nr:SUMF1/EgtB/PvdO family nonheme iron enzyme [Oscillatoria sp. FACHB-1407]MBD2460130.1 SUMF1/EgtB/PvdO family nonheme iron enzyme [Oscillatoria sp. FACHB-1407]